MYETIKKFLDEGGKCLLIENGKPIGVALTIGEYELLKNKSQKEEKIKPETEQLLIPRINSGLVVDSKNPISGAMVQEMNFPDLPAEAPLYGAKEGASAELADFDIEEDVTLEDLGLDELPN